MTKYSLSTAVKLLSVVLCSSACKDEVPEFIFACDEAGNDGVKNGCCRWPFRPG